MTVYTMLSVVITAWNEAKNLTRVVNSVKAIADEIIVVDTESTDATAAIAKKLGCKVYKHKNTGIVEPVRNYSISKTIGDWVLLLDADEEVPQPLAKRITELISSDSADYYRLPRKNLIFNKWISSSHWWPDYVYRLFKKGYIVWSDVIHSVPQTRGRGADVPATEKFAILHHHYDSVSQYVDRINRYTDHQLSYLKSQRCQFVWTDLVTKPAQEFIRQYFARDGFKDGLHGLALAGLQGFSELVLYLKLWQSSDFPPQSISLQHFNQETMKQFKQFRWWLYEKQGIFGKLLRKLKQIFV